MVDAVLVNKSAVIQRCVSRAGAEYSLDPTKFHEDFTRQDAAILNIVRACQAAIDLATAIIRRRRIGLPQTTREQFGILCDAGIVDRDLSARLQSMAGFRNIVDHDYQAVDIELVEEIIKDHLDNLLEFTHIILRECCG